MRICHSCIYRWSLQVKCSNWFAITDHDKCSLGHTKSEVTSWIGNTVSCCQLQLLVYSHRYIPFYLSRIGMCWVMTRHQVRITWLVLYHRLEGNIPLALGYVNNQLALGSCTNSDCISISPRFLAPRATILGVGPMMAAIFGVLVSIFQCFSRALRTLFYNWLSV